MSLLLEVGVDLPNAALYALNVLEESPGVIPVPMCHMKTGAGLPYITASA